MPAPPLTGRIARIVRGSVHDGPGVRTVVFFKGCPLKCRWCHSPETQDARPEVLLLRDRCIRCGTCVAACAAGAARMDPDGPATDASRCDRCGSCAGVCPTGAREIVGAALDEDDVMEVVRRDVPFYDASSGGVTFSGGEPLLQPDFLEALLDRCRSERIRAAIETCGHVNPEALRRVRRYAPLFLYDLKLADRDRHRSATGASNATIVGNLRELAASGAEIVIRFPLVPGINDSTENVKGVAWIAVAAGVRRIDVLPYHRAGLAKYARLNRSYALDHVPAATPERAAAAVEVMRRFGVDARVGGSS
jgi:pyruvate formate lyase activating enzyme